MDIVKFKEAYREIEKLIYSNFDLIKKAYPGDVGDYIHRWGFDTDCNEIDITTIYRFDDDTYYISLPLPVFESEQTLQKYLNERITEREETERKKREEEERLKEEKRKCYEELKKDQEYKKYLELKEKFGTLERYLELKDKSNL